MSKNRFAMQEPGMEKVYLNKTDRQLNYATPQALNELLLSLQARYDVPLREAVKFVCAGLVDGIVLTKNIPYFDFHAKKVDDTVWIAIKELKQDMEFKVELNQLKLCLN